MNSLVGRSGVDGAALELAGVQADQPRNPALEEGKVLLGDHHGAVLEVDLHQRLQQSLADLRREAEGRLINQQQFGVVHQPAPEADHAPLAAGELPHGLIQQFLQRREDRQHILAPLLAFAPGALGVGAAVEMVGDGEAVKQRVTLRHQGEPHAHDLVRVASGPLAACATDLHPVQLDRAALPAGEAGDRPQQRRLAMAVEPDDADALARAHRQVDAVQHAERTVAGREVLDAQDVAHAASTSK